MANILSEDVKELVMDCVEKHNFPQDCAFNVLKVKDEDQLVKVFVDMFKLTREFSNYILCDLIWSWKNTEDFLNQKNMHFFRTLLQDGGSMTKTKLQRTHRIFATEFLVKNAVEDLSEMGLIEVIKLNNKRVIYIISPGFLAKKLGEFENDK